MPLPHSINEEGRGTSLSLSAGDLTFGPLCGADVDAATRCGLDAWCSVIGGNSFDFSANDITQMEAQLHAFMMYYAAGQADPHDLLTLAKADGAVVGFCALDCSTSYLSDLCVDPLWQRQGVGAALMEDARGKLRQVGQNHLTLEVFAQNTRACSFYRKQGLEVMERKVKYDPLLKRNLLKMVMRQVL
ncbi:GNAT family N-acetyltransferase [Cohaesibacter haloalkalitolerans]|uniref:GNAT family N-acetyltransferase n=1 Tax=Cohaesibacter haloalkalitolerans TaxID=1162980 RepID=UPI000E64C620|nr:GNAT family N-acetyltransferase [Cohaesibacter haloalkalitolerans]